MAKELNILSLGAGVQSTTVLLMSEKGELPKLDCAIFADTGCEPKAVYEHLEWLKHQTSIPIHQVAKGNLMNDSLTRPVKREGSNGEEVMGKCSKIPCFTKGESIGQTQRQCTADYKIAPLEKYVKRTILGLQPRQRVPKDKHVKIWLGISTDEIRRARVSELYWKENYFPLILDAKMSRVDCLNWLDRNYPGHTCPRSACIICPYHSDAEWRNLTEEEFQQAVRFDKAIRKTGGMRGELYLHRSCIPLDQIDFDDDTQGDWINECTGGCGL